MKEAAEAKFGRGHLLSFSACKIEHSSSVGQTSLLERPLAIRPPTIGLRSLPICNTQKACDSKYDPCALLDARSRGRFTSKRTHREFVMPAGLSQTQIAGIHRSCPPTL